MSHHNTGHPSTSAFQYSGPTQQGSSQHFVDNLLKVTSTVIKNISALWVCCVPVFLFLLHSFTQSKGKEKTETYKDFIERVYPHVNYRKAFNNEQRKYLNQTSCDAFDVSLVYALLPVLCDAIEHPGNETWKLKIIDDNTFEYWFKKAKELRNNLQHERKIVESQSFLSELEQVLIELLEKSKTTLGIAAVDVNLKKTEIENTFITLKNLLMDGKTLMLLSKVMNFEKFKEDVQNYFKTDLIDVASKQLNREDVFFPITLNVKSACDPKIIYNVKYEEILKNPASLFLVVTGVPGSGKTTLLRALFKSWASQDEKAANSKGLHFNVAVMIICRDQKHISIVERLRQTFPNTFGAAALDKKKIEEALDRLTMIIFVDGYDELNESSQKLMEDVMSYQERYKGRMRVIITSRPEAAAELTKELSKRSISWQLATMAPVNDNIKYLELYEEALKKHGTGQGLVEAFRRLEESIKNILNTPVLLALFVELYIYDEKTIDTWRTEHDIMCSYIDMIRNEIVERVRKGKDDMGNPFTKPTARANAILQSVALLALKMHTHMKMHLREHDYMALNDKVNDDKKNPLNTLGEDTFKSVLSCVLTPQQAATGTERQYEFSHLSFQEVLAAKALEENLEGIDEPTTRNTLQTEHGRNSHQRSNDGTSAFKTTIKKLTGVEVTHIRRYANIVKYVMSFLKKHQKLQTHGPILAGVIREMKAGLNYSIDVIAASGNDGVVAELVTRTAEESETINKWEIIAAKHIEAATLMLRLLEQREGVELLRAELKEVLTKQHYTALEELLDLLAQKYSHVMVGITLHHSYEECVPVDGLVKKMKSLKELKWFTGCVAEEESLLALRNSRWAQGSLMHLSTKDPELKLYLLGGSDGRCGARGLWFTLHYTEEHLPARPLPVCSIGRPPYLYIKRCPKEAQEQQLIDLIVNLAPKYEDDGREYKGYWGLFLTHCGLTDESVNAVLRGLQQRHVRTYGGGNTRAERQTKDDGKCDVPSLPRHTHLDGTACWLLYSRDT